MSTGRYEYMCYFSAEDKRRSCQVAIKVAYAYEKSILMETMVLRLLKGSLFVPTYLIPMEAMKHPGNVSHFALHSVITSGFVQ